MRSGRLAGTLAGVGLLVAGGGAQAAPLSGAPPAVSAGQHATLRTFAGRWYGHGRALRISRHGKAREQVYDGCCDHVIDLKFRLRHPHGSATRARARGKVTSVHVYDKRFFTSKYPAPVIGQTRTVKRRRGVLHEPFIRTTYCTAHEQMKGTCGA